MPLPASRPQCFPRSMRLRHGWEFRHVKDQGSRIVRGCLIFNWIKMSQGETSRLGVITTRHLGGAVVRSRARRLLRESFRRVRHRLACPVDMVLVARKSIIGRSQQEVERHLMRALDQSRLLLPA